MPDKGREPHIDQQLRQSLGGQAFPTPEGSWDRIAHSLDRRARRKAWFMGSAAVFAILLIGSGLWLALDNKVHIKTPMAAVQTEISDQQPAAASQVQVLPQTDEANNLQHGAADGSSVVSSTRSRYRSNSLDQSEGRQPRPDKPADHLPAAENNGRGISDETAANTENAAVSAETENLHLRATVPFELQAAAPENGNPLVLALPVLRRAMQQQPALRLGIGSTPAYTFDVLRTAAQQAGFMHQDYIGIRRAQEAPTAALSAGLDLSLRLRKGLVVQSGAWLQEYSVSQRYDYRIVNIPSYRGGVTDIYGNKLIEAYFTSANPEKVSYTGRSRYRSLRIPLQAGWSHSVGDGFEVVGLGGLSSSILLEESGRQINYSNLSLSNNPILRMRKMQWSALLQVGIEKSLYRNVWLGTSFRWESALHNRYIQASPLRSAPQQTGIQFNLQYRIY